MDNLNLISAIASTILSLIISGAIIYTKKIIESTAETASKKAIIEFQSEQSLNIYKLQLRYQRQLDVSQELFQKFRFLANSINLLLDGSITDIESVINYKLDFYKTFHSNNLIFSKRLCKQIETIFPLVDDFINAYNSKVILEEILEELEIINDNLDFEFRLIHQTTADYIT